MTIQIHPTATKIMNTIIRNGFQAFVVGGAVRDAIMGITPEDWDIATDASPDAVISMFHRVIPTGIEHGTVTVMIDGGGFEVTTFRTDFNHRGHHCDVAFIDNIHGDVSRRDFTMNAMAADVDGNVIDFFGGIADIDNKVIRFVGDATTRITEDPIRMMRAIRFAAQKGFTIDPTAMVAIAQNARAITRISVERFTDEFVKIVTANPDMIMIVWQSGIMDFVMPEVAQIFRTTQNNFNHCFDNVGIHTVVAMRNVTDIRHRMAVMFHDIGKCFTKTTGADGIDHFFGHAEVSANHAEIVMRRMHFSNADIAAVVPMVRHHGGDMMATPRSVRRFINRVGVDNFADIMAVRMADDMAKDIRHPQTQTRMADAAIIMDIFADIVAQNQAVDKSQIAVNGHDMMAIGFRGRDIGAVINAIVNAVIDDPDMNNFDDCMAFAKNFKIAP